MVLDLFFNDLFMALGMVLGTLVALQDQVTCGGKRLLGKGNSSKIDEKQKSYLKP